MHPSLSKAFRILLAIITLTLGGLIYYAYRAETLSMFKWAEYLGLERLIACLRDFTSNSRPSEFVVYCLPNALWSASYLLAVDALVATEDHKLVWGISLPTIAIILEVCQAFNIISGTFDILDLLCFLTPTIIFIAYYKFTYYEKNY